MSDRDKNTLSASPNVKKPGVKMDFTPEQVQEYIKCVKDPVYFIKNYVKIITLDHGVVPFEMWPWQENIVRSFNEERYVICKIGRQSGKTATTSAYLLWSILFNENYTVAIMANKHSTAMEIVDRIKLSYEMLPLWIQQGVTEWNKTSIVLENGSRIISSSTSPAAIRGFAINCIFLDEFAIVPNNIQDEFFTSVFPTISSGKTTKVFIASTPMGMNRFYKVWTEAEDKKNEFKPISVHWSDIPGRDEEWRKKQVAILGERGFDQEFNTEFLGSSMTLIDGKKLQAIPTRDPIHETMDGFKFYEKADRSKSYVMVVDTARGTGLDYSAFIVFDTTETPFRVVCTFRNNNVHTIVFPKYIMEAATYYNDCYILVETNDLGQQIVDILHYDLEYDGLITTATRTKRHEATSGFGVKSSLGVKTTKNVKRTGCSTFKSMVETDQLVINDFHLFNEMTTFALNGAGSYEATDGNHDDLVMCGVLFAWLSTQPYFKDMTGTDVSKNIYRIGTEDMDEYMTPFGGIDDGRSPSSTLYGGDLWEDI